jgi:hypothetical protein
MDEATNRLVAGALRSAAENEEAMQSVGMTGDSVRALAGTFHADEE